MNEVKDINQTSGDNGININGNNNKVNFYKPPIKYELLSKICRQFISSNLCIDATMNIHELPLELLKKIEYNDLKCHKELYEELGIYFSDISDIVDKTLGTDSIKLIGIVKTLYLEILANNPNYSGDQLLFAIENRLLEHISIIESDEYLNEDIRNSVSQVVLYVFEKCQILKKPIE